MHHQKRILLTIRLWLIVTITTLWWDFPLHEVARPECKSQKRDDLNNECRINIMEAQNNADLAKLLFSALWWTSYDTPQTLQSGWHPSLDMPWSPGTPIYAIQDGIVMNASEKAGYWLSVTIKHTLDGKSIYSNYSHLEEALVKKWDTVKAGQQIAKLWCSGFSISGDPTRCGNHLDFQITTDKSPSHPYGYGDCPEGYMNAVNKWLCKEKLEAYTIDPLVFFKEHANITFKVAMIQEVATKSTIPNRKTKLTDLLARLRVQNQAILAKKSTTQSSENTVNTDISNLATSINKPSPTTVVEKNYTTVDNYRISRERNSSPDALVVDKVVTLAIIVKDQLGNPVTGILPQTLSVKLDNFVLWSFFPEWFLNITEWKKHLFLQTKQTGNARVSLRWGEKKIGEESIQVK